MGDGGRLEGKCHVLDARTKVSIKYDGMNGAKASQYRSSTRSNTVLF